MRKTVPVLLMAVVCVSALIQGPALGNDSVYSDLDLDTCRTLDEDPMGSSLRCPGHRDLPVYFKEGDLRQSVLFGKVDQRLIDGAFESFSAFNHVNTKIEWRRDDEGKVIAAILRWFIDNPGPDGSSNKAGRGEILVVSKVASDGDGRSCFVAMIDGKANRDANELARQTADNEALDFACGVSEPRWIGKRGELTSERMFSWPDSSVIE